MFWVIIGGFGIISVGTFLLIIISTLKHPNRDFRSTITPPTVKQEITHVHVTIQAPREDRWSLFKVAKKIDAERKAQIDRRHRYHSRNGW